MSDVLRRARAEGGVESAAAMLVPALVGSAIWLDLMRRAISSD
jgi:hypothetical protein